MSSTSKLNNKTNHPATVPPPAQPQKWPAGMLKMDMLISELSVQGRLALPMVVMNLAWFGKAAITTAFLGRLGELSLAGGAIGFMFANVTGFSVLNGLCGAMEAICGQAQALAFHIPINIVLSKTMGLIGVSMAVWITDLIIVVLLAIYVVILENTKGNRWKDGGWWDQSFMDWIRLVKLGGSCSLNTCLEWWCYEILVLLTGHLKNAKEAVGVLAIVLNLDYLFFSVMLSLGTCVSTRVSNELGANQAGNAYRSAFVSLALGFILGWIGSLLMVAVRGSWAALFSHDNGIIKGVKKTMLLMALTEVFNFPLAVCGGIVRGTARPWLGMYSNLGGFYFLALPLGVILAFKFHHGLVGFFIGLNAGIVICLMMDLVFIVRLNWVKEASKAQTLVSDHQVQNVPKYDAEELSTVQANHEV
ncbi:putative multi antimicrobial extrusion protein [Lupinus albus]|uniref:Putative multi antimicrobial extrusion protein n=1 Tax=Lupinus albus TaxID=3870 RepID=A0A6A4PZR8_LUPAL|nr:putative multi antimicrobial extrusion protein [Lupinus albus]